MKIQTQLLNISVTLFICFGLSIAAYAGGAATGGGTVCTNSAVNNGNPMLLDLALSNMADLIDNPYTGSRLHSGKIAEAIGANFVKLRQNRAYKFALAKIQAWEHDPSSRDSAYLVALGLKNIQFMVTPLRIKRLSRVYLPPQSKCKTSNLQTAILYRSGVLYISLPVWNELGLLSQAGLLIHEALRNVQLFEQLGGTDADLERLTLEILLGPDQTVGRDSLNAEPFFAKYISSGAAGALVANDCVQLKSAMKKYAPLKNFVPTSDVHSICTADLTLDGDSSAVVNALLRVQNELADAYSAVGYDYHYDFLQKLSLQMGDTVDSLTTGIVGRLVYRAKDYTIPLGVSQLYASIAFGIVQRYLNGQPLANSPTTEVRLERKTRLLIQKERVYFEQLFNDPNGGHI